MRGARPPCGGTAVRSSRPLRADRMIAAGAPRHKGFYPRESGPAAGLSTTRPRHAARDEAGSRAGGATGRAPAGRQAVRRRGDRPCAGSAQAAAPEGSVDAAPEPADGAGGDAAARVEMEARRAAVGAAVETRVGELAAPAAPCLGALGGEAEGRGGSPRRCECGHAVRRTFPAGPRNRAGSGCAMVWPADERGRDDRGAGAARGAVRWVLEPCAGASPERLKHGRRFRRCQTRAPGAGAARPRRARRRWGRLLGEPGAAARTSEPRRRIC